MNNTSEKLNCEFRLRHGIWPEYPGNGDRRLVWSIVVMLMSVLCMEFISLFWTAQRYDGLFEAYGQSPAVLILNLLPLVLVAAILYCLTGHVVVTVMVTGLLELGLSLVNCIKLNLRGDPLLFSDLLLAGEAGEIMERYAVVLDRGEVLGIVAFFLLVIVADLLAGGIRLKGHRVQRGIALLCSVALFAGMLLYVYPNRDLYYRAYSGGETVSRRNAAQWYAAHGFTYSFLNSVVEEEYGIELLGVGTNESEEDTSLLQIPEEETLEADEPNVNIIAIQLEAYFDLSAVMDNEAVAEAYAQFHAIEADSISGNLLVNVNGGGTIDTERSVISGYTALTDFATPTNSYAWYLRSLGYTVEGSHPNTGSFYDRDSVNANLGFQNYYFIENHYEDLINKNTATIDSDTPLFEEIVNLMEAAEGPYFSLNIGYQNHGPYDADSCTGTEYLTEEDCENETVRNITNNYLNLLQSTNQGLTEMVERLNGLDQPVLLVVFGDHLPYLGDYTDMEPFEALGVNMDVATDEGYYNYYSTPYFIWANQTARSTLGTECVGDGGDIAPCFLMNKVFALCGWHGDEFMMASNALMDGGFSMISSAVEVYRVDGELMDTLDSEHQRLLNAFLEFQSEWQENFRYEAYLDEAEEDSGTSGTNNPQSEDDDPDNES